MIDSGTRHAIVSELITSPVPQDLMGMLSGRRHEIVVYWDTSHYPHLAFTRPKYGYELRYTGSACKFRKFKVQNYKDWTSVDIHAGFSLPFIWSLRTRVFSNLFGAGKGKC